MSTRPNRALRKASKDVDRKTAILDTILHPNIQIHVLPGGKMPERQTEGAIGYDVFARAIVDPKTMDLRNPSLRQTIFAFGETCFADDALSHITTADREDGQGCEYVYRLDPGESVLVGIGFITAMPFPMFYWVAPRSGLASRYGISVTNAPGTVDPDYRGEAGVLVLNRSDKPFLLRREMRIAQIIFQWALIPEIAEVYDHHELSPTVRGAGGFGSTGLQ